jgi:hypothetical protein
MIIKSVFEAKGKLEQLHMAFGDEHHQVHQRETGLRNLIVSALVSVMRLVKVVLASLSQNKTSL